MGETAKRRRRSKPFVKLSGKRTVTGLNSGEHIFLEMSPTGSLKANLSGTMDRGKEATMPPCLCFYLSIRIYKYKFLIDIVQPSDCVFTETRRKLGCLKPLIKQVSVTVAAAVRSTLLMG
ncbi:hypothetical protein SDC9_172096 [bioreactor metagenome]|uniref:Uncharacterized protein n=1 Tax=bioreactor metagenome TaxID=1076179 RepID=A0A645GL80_9ZZZZ